MYIGPIGPTSDKIELFTLCLKDYLHEHSKKLLANIEIHFRGVLHIEANILTYRGGCIHTVISVLYGALG